MKLGSVLKKERERKKLSADDVAQRLNVSVEAYLSLESGDSPIEEWGPKLGKIAINLKCPTARLITQSGKFKSRSESIRKEGGCGDLIRWYREQQGLSRQQLSERVSGPFEEIVRIEEGKSPLEIYAPYLLHFAETVDLPIFNLLYPCGLPLDQLTDYP